MVLVLVLTVQTVNMILPIYEYDINEYERLNKAFIALYGDNIYSLIQQQVNQESLVGYSCIMYKVVQFHLAFLLGYTIMMDYRTTDQDWDYYEDKYDLENKRKYLACSGIKLEDLLEIFGLPPSETGCEYGIGEMTISGECEECPFIIGTETCDDLTVATVDMAELLATYEDGPICEYFLDNC